MNCKQCEAPLMENDQFCKSCGSAVNTATIQNNIGGNQQTFEQNTYSNIEQPMNDYNNGYNSQPANNYQQPMNDYNNGYNSQPANNYQQPMNDYNNGYNSQPVNNYQQPMNNYNNGINSQQMYNQSQKNGSNKIIFIIIGAIALIAIIVFLILGGASNLGSIGGGSNGGSTIGTSKSNYTVNFKGFTFKIPTNLVYQTNSDSILLGDEDGTWAASIEIMEGSYNQMLSNKNRLHTVFQQQGYKATTAIEKNIGGVNFITLEVSKSGNKALLGLSKANSMYLFGATAYNVSNEIDYDILKTISPILNSAEYNDVTSNISTFEKIDISGINGLAQ